MQGGHGVHEVAHRTEESEGCTRFVHPPGTRHVKDTLVGNALVRGLSGGERKRVTLAEM